MGVSHVEMGTSFLENGSFQNELYENADEGLFSKNIDEDLFSNEHLVGILDSMSRELDASSTRKKGRKQPSTSVPLASHSSILAEDEKGKISLCKDILIPYNDKECSLTRCTFDVDLTDEIGTITASVFADLGNKELPFEKAHEDLKSKICIAPIKPGKTRKSNAFQCYTINYFIEDFQGQPPAGTIADQSSQNATIEPSDNLITNKNNAPLQQLFCLAKQFDGRESSKNPTDGESEDDEPIKGEKSRLT
ncbi:hypothetical protein ACH5RR_021588 [Cinchona calisaya]|uniref:Uncharacterized protein n=1 Tax=Cinchona calisaya TaxID=153742 RepID=A0ABD2ZHQ8_9GENT